MGKVLAQLNDFPQEHCSFLLGVRTKDWGRSLDGFPLRSLPQDVAPNVIRLADTSESGVGPRITKRQLAEHLQMSELWIELRMREGLPHSKWRSGAVRFKVTAVEAWLQNGRSS